MTKDTETETPEPVSAPTREELLQLYGETLNAVGLGSAWPLGQACVAVVLAAQGAAADPEPSAPAEPATGDCTLCVDEPRREPVLFGYLPPEPGPMVPDAPGLWELRGEPVWVCRRTGGLKFVARPMAKSERWEFVDAIQPENWGGPVVHPSTIAADRVQDIADAHAEVKGLKRQLAAANDQADKRLTLWRDAERKMAAQALTAERDEYRARLGVFAARVDVVTAELRDVRELHAASSSACTDLRSALDAAHESITVHVGKCPELYALAKAAVSHWGAEEQLDMLTEECAEVIQARNKLRRGEPSALLAEEVADVKIMVAQAEEILGHDVIDAHLRAKLDRLRKLLEAGGGL